MQGGGRAATTPPPPHGPLLPIFLKMKMTFNLDKLWYGVRYCKGEFEKIHDNTTKDNVTVTSLNISQNGGMIKILKILKSLPIFLTMKMTFNLNKFWHGIR